MKTPPRGCRMPRTTGSAAIILEPVGRGTGDARAEYAAILGSRAESRLGPIIAIALEDAIAAKGWHAGMVYGPEAALAESFGVSVRLIRQAFRLVEARGGCRLQRGRSGGLIVQQPSLAAAATTMASYLRWRGVTADEIWKARRLIETRAAIEAAEAASDGPPDPSKRGLGERIVDAVNPFLAVSLTCLDQFAHDMASMPNEIALGLSAAIGRGDPTAAAQLSLAGVEARRCAWWREARDPFDMSPTSPSSIDRSLAARVANRIGSGLRHADCLNGVRLGSTWDIAERHGVGLSVAVEAVRLLEDAGVAECVKGRTGGVELREPVQGSVIRALHGFLAASKADPALAARLGQDMNSAAADEAVERMSSAKAIRLHAAVGSLERASPDAVMPAWYDVQRSLYDAAENKVLHVITAAFSGYVVRRHGLGVAHRYPGFTERIRQAGIAAGMGVMNRDRDRALRGQALARETLSARHQTAPLAAIQI